MGVCSRSCPLGAPPPSALPTTQRGHGRVSRDRSLARAREAARGRRWRAGGLPVRARQGREREGRGGAGRGRAGGGRAAGCRAGGVACGWPGKRVPGGRKRGGDDAAFSVRSAGEAPEGAEELRAGVGGLERPPGHGGCGRWLARQRCGRETCGAGAVAALTPAGPSRSDEAEPLPRPASAAPAGCPRGGWGSAGGRAAPAPAPAPASAAREAATGGADRARGA